MFLTNEKIKGILNSIIILDIDGTITTDSDNNIDKSIIELINELKRKNKIYVCSNSKDSSRNSLIAQIIDVPLIISPYKKPDRKIVKQIDNKDNKKIIVIGDKFLTDGLFCINIKGTFIRVKRLQSGKEKVKIKLINLLDDITFALWRIITKRKF